AILIILIGSYLIERVLDILNLNRRKMSLPEEVADVFSEEKYKKQQAYGLVNEKFYFITASFSLLILLAMLFFEGFAWLDALLRQITNHPILLTLIYFALIAVVSDIINMPFAIYMVFTI